MGKITFNEIILADPEVDYGQGKIIKVQCVLAGEVTLMGRNDSCFCGSGKKTKKCHPDINESSLVAKLLGIYAEIDKRNSKANTICEIGCADCCADDFEIHLSEFMAILDYLKIGSPFERVRHRELREAINRYNPEVRGWCMFLDQKEKICKIYAVRPLVCRNYGTTRQATYPICAPMQLCSGENRLLDECDYPHIDTTTNRINLTNEHTKITLQSKMQPLIMWFKSNVDDSGTLNTQKMRDMFRAATKLNVDEVLRIMQG